MKDITEEEIKKVMNGSCEGASGIARNSVFGEGNPGAARQLC